MVTNKHLMPEPTSRFINIECESCNSQCVIFSMSKSVLNCKFCGNVLVKPTGGKPVIFGKLLEIKDDHLTSISPNAIQKDSDKNTVKLLLDTMIIHELINGISIHDIVHDISNRSVNFILIDRILIETTHMERQEYGVHITSEDIVNKLEEIGTVDKMQLDHASEDIIKAREMYESKKYVNEKQVPLSETDCILLQMSLGLQDVQLVTHDKTLKDAIQKERNLLSALSDSI